MIVIDHRHNQDHPGIEKEEDNLPQQIHILPKNDETCLQQDKNQHGRKSPKVLFMTHI